MRSSYYVLAFVSLSILAFPVAAQTGGASADPLTRAIEEAGVSPADAAALRLAAAAVTRNPIKLAASDANANDDFGYSVALDSVRALIGVPQADVGTAGAAGAAYVFTLTDGVWTQEAKLTASDPATDARFGHSVALDDGRILIGAQGADIGSASAVGAAYVFSLADGVWTQDFKLPSPSVNGNTYFGSSVALDDGWALIGAYRADVGTTLEAGAAYVFDLRTPGVWTYDAAVLPFDPASAANFGWSVALDGGRALVGAYGAAIGGETNAGAAYVFDLAGGSWVQQAKLTASDPFSFFEFGFSVALDGDRALIGARGEGFGGEAMAGAAYVFDLIGGTWVQQAKLTASDRTSNDNFGSSVALDGARALVGAPEADMGANARVGAVYVFDLFAGSWGQKLKLTASDPTMNGYFGRSVALDGFGALIGADGALAGGTPNAGAVYAFPGGPVLEMVPAQAAFGDVLVGASPERSVTISNYGYFEAATFTATSTNNAFTVSPAAFMVAPGFSTDITVAFTPGVAGAYTADIVLTGAGAESPDTLTMTGAAHHPRLALTADTLALGEAPRGGSLQADMTVTNTESLADLNVTVTTADDAFAVSSASFTLASGASKEITVTFSPAAPGDFTTDVLFSYDSPESPDTLVVTGAGSSAELLYTSDSLLFPSITAGLTHTLSTAIQVGGTALEVADVSVTSDVFVVQGTTSNFTVPANGSHDFTVTFSPVEAGPYQGELVITHNMSGSPDTLILEGFALGAEIAIQGTSELTFPTTRVYETSSQTLQISNPGTHSLRISDISVLDTSGHVHTDVFGTLTDTLIVPPGGSEYENLTVTFTPEDLGPTAGLLSIEHNAPDSPTLVSLTGTGAMPPIELRPFAETAEVSAPSFVTVAFQATSNGHGITFLGETEFYDVTDNMPNVVDVDEDVEALLKVEDFGSIPFTIKTVLMLDNSSSLFDFRDDIQNAARAFVADLLPQQEVAIYVFTDEITMLQDFTQDVDSLNAAIDGIGRGANSTNLYGAVVEGTSAWEDIFVVTGENQRVELGNMVLFSDGLDNSGLVTEQEALIAIADKDVFVVTVGATVDPELDVLHTAAGDPIAVGDYAELEGAFQDVQEELVRTSNSLYWLAYASTRRGDEERSFTVSLKENLNTDSGSSFTVLYNSAGFGTLDAGVYVNRTARSLTGIDELMLDGSGDTTLTAETLLGSSFPMYVWSVPPDAGLTITPLNDNVSEVRLEYSRNVASSIDVTVTDEVSNLSTTITVNAMAVVASETPDVPAGFALYPNYPNPFSGHTTLTFSLGKPEHVRLQVYDVLGRRVATLVDARRAAGNHVVTFAGSELAGGVYFVQMQAGSFRTVRQLTILR